MSEPKRERYLELNMSGQVTNPPVPPPPPFCAVCGKRHEPNTPHQFDDPPGGGNP